MKIFSCIAFLSLSLSVCAQQEVLQFDYFPQGKSVHSPSLKSMQVPVLPPLISLPFYDDFSSSSPYPNSQRWMDSSVYINDCFAVKPPSIGVATFDALDKYGRLHRAASSSSFYADTLTSRPIALAGLSAVSNKPADSLALSFYYQRGGIDYVENIPDESDSLLLQMYFPAQRYGIYINEISAHGVELYNSTFTAVKIAGCTIVVGTDSARYTYTISGLLLDSLSPYYHQYFTVEQFGTPAVAFAPHTGDTIFVYQPDGVFSDSVVYNNSAPLYNSYGRSKDGAATFVEFSQPTMGAPNGDWQEVWSIGGNKSKPVGNDKFVYHRIFFNDSKQIVNGFRFRFINTASLSNDPSHARNGDFFHIDHVYLASRKGGIVDYSDVAFASPLISFLGDYASVPYSHLAARGSTNDLSTFFFDASNFSRNDEEMQYAMSIQKLYADSATVTQQMNFVRLPSEHNIPDTLNFFLYFNPFDVFLSDLGKRSDASFEVKYFFTHNNLPEHAPYRWNDTLRYIQDFGNYYAYDDGSSEAGYGVRGENSMSVAEKFKIYQKDTLRAVSMFFNPTIVDPEMTAKRFFLAIWKDSGGKPGELIYKSPTIVSVDRDVSGYNSFQTILIDPAGIVAKTQELVIEGDIHIGWMQTSDFLMSIGVDLNRMSANKVNYRIGTKWTLAQTKHPLMIRPHLGNYFTVSDDFIADENLNCTVYPNPAHSTISVSCTGADSLYLYSLTGTLVAVLPVIDSQADVSSLVAGAYVMQISRNNTIIGSASLMIQN